MVHMHAQSHSYVPLKGLGMRLPTHHLQCPSDDPTDNVGVQQLWVVLRKLHKLYQRILVQDQRKFITPLVPIGNYGYNSQEGLEANLCNVGFLYDQEVMLPRPSLAPILDQKSFRKTRKQG